MIFVLGALLAVSVSAFIWLWLAYKKLERKINWVETSPHVIESMMELSEHLNKLGKAIVEIKCMDQAGIFYREPIR